MKSFLNSFPDSIPYAQLLQGRAVGRATGIINLVLVLFIAWSLARLTWSLWPMPQSEAPPLLASATLSTEKTPAEATMRLADLHLFGEAKEQEPTPDTALTAPETQLKLTLSGVLSAADKLTARAIIAGPDGDEKPYAVGDTLPGNATLHQILVDRVILKSGGRYETLRLPEDSNGVAPVPGMTGMANVPGPTGMLGGPGANLQQYRQQILNNPAKLFDLVQVVPISQNGVFQGFRLGPGRDPRMLQRFGLQPGDTVTQVNGIALDDPAKGAQALQSIATASSINLTIKRGGTEQQVTVRLDGGDSGGGEGE
jgi:general secretion pathway protein C